MEGGGSHQTSFIGQDRRADPHLLLWLGSHPLSALHGAGGSLSLWPEHPWEKQSLRSCHPLAPGLSLSRPQAALQVGGHGERLTQCREVLLTTSKAIPVQVDGEPCKLAASCIRISLRNQATMVQKAKRRSAAPLHSEYAPPQPQFSHLERRLTVPRGSWVGHVARCLAGTGSPGEPWPSAVWSPRPQPAASAGAAADPGEQGQHA